MRRIIWFVALAAALAVCAGCRAAGAPPATAVYAGGPAFTDAAAALAPLDPATLADRADLAPVPIGVPARLPL